MALDLGSLIKDLGMAAISNRYQPDPIFPNYGVQVTPTNNPYILAGAGEGFGIPGFDVVGTGGKDNMVYDPNANCGSGKWIKKRRRRHRKLATKGDLQGLAALKGILGGGKAFEVWIATHS